MTKPRPKEVPYVYQSPYALMVYGVRLLFQLWPIWLMLVCGNGIERGLSEGLSRLVPPLTFMFAWFAPFLKFGVAVLLIRLTYVLKRWNMANWNTVDAATGALIVSILLSVYTAANRLGFPASGLYLWMFSSPAHTQLFTMLAVAVGVGLLGMRTPVGRWIEDLLTPVPTADETGKALSPKIIGTVKAPQAAGVQQVDAAKLAAALTERVIGQEVIADQLAKAVARRMVQVRRGKPVFTALFAGPTGVGKTEMAKAAAQALYGTDAVLFRVDCGNVLGEAGLQTLVGAPTGYMGSDKPGALTAHVARFPNGILLFDEIEKAMGQQGAQSPLFRLLLSLLDEGRFTEQSTGQTVDATGCIILMTSNAAHKSLGQIFERYKDDAAALTRATKDELQGYFAPEFLARIDLVTTFSPLDAPARAKVIALHAGRIAAQYELKLDSIDADLVSEGLVQWQKLEAYGAREMVRWLEDKIADPIILAKRAGAKLVALTYKAGVVTADIKK